MIIIHRRDGSTEIIEETTPASDIESLEYVGSMRMHPMTKISCVVKVPPDDPVRRVPSDDPARTPSGGGTYAVAPEEPPDN